MSKDVESQLAAFARSLDARSQRPSQLEASPELPRRRAGIGALALATLAAVLLVVLPIVFFNPPEMVSPPSTVPSPTTIPPSTWVPTTEPGPSVIPSEGWAILGRSGITASDGSVVWAGEGSGRGRLVRDGAGGLVFTDSEGLWWMPRTMAEPRLIAEASGELVEVIQTSTGPVARLGLCPSTYVNLLDGTSADERLGRIHVDCATGRQSMMSSLNLVLTPPDPDGIIWLHVIEFDMTSAYLPVGGPFASVRIEDFDGGRVLLSRDGADRDQLPDHLILVDLHEKTVEEITTNPSVDTSAALLGPDPEGLPGMWGPSWIGEPPHNPAMTDFFDRLPLSLRSDPLWEFEAAEGTWVLSRPSEGLLHLSDAWGCGIPGTEWCTYEYGEILLTSDVGLEFVLPTPGAPSTWLAVRDEYVYAGRIGDGALPNSTLIRIDRATRESITILFRTGGEIPLWPSLPLVVNPGDPMWDRFEAAVSLAPNRAEPVGGTTPVFVDFDAIDSLIEDLIAQRTVID